MSFFVNEQQQLNDIIFKGRNKSYGAYVLRSSYDVTVMRSLFIMILCVSLISFCAWKASGHDIPVPDTDGQVIDDEIIYTVTVNQPEEPLPEKKNDTEKPLPAENPEKSSAQSTVIAETDIEQTDTAVNTEPDGIVSEGESDRGAEFSGGTGTSSAVTARFSPDSVHHDYQVDAAPQFRGGLPALTSFLKNNVRYPREPADLGIEGHVVIRFVVDEKGRITAAKVKGSTGELFTSEALRVVELLPDFESPGYVKGQPVKTYYELPFRFRLKH